MKRYRPALLLVLLILIIPSGTLSAQTSQPPPAQVKPLLSQNLSEKLIDNLPATLAAIIAAVLGGIGGLIKVKKEFDRKLSGKDEEFTNQLLLALLEKDNIDIIRKQGEFVTVEQLNKLKEKVDALPMQLPRLLAELPVKPGKAFGEVLEISKGGE